MVVSNLGMYGVDAFVAIVDIPGPMILAAGHVNDRIVPVNRQPAIYPMCTLTLSVDHRALDGLQGTQFLMRVKDLLEQPFDLLGHDMIKQAFVETEQKTQVINITAQLADMVAGMPDGLALFYTLHTTVTLLISEDDPELRDDLIRAATDLLASCRAFKHVRSNNPNAEAHIISALGGTCLTVAVVGGKPDLGTYQNILLLEMDGPKRREIRCCIVA